MAEGYKDWSAGEILTAADLEDYTVKQSVMRFDDSSARTTALSAVLAEGMMSYLKDTDSVEVYDGSSWAAVAGGKILQIVRATDTVDRATTSTTTVDANISVTITPTSATSDILVLWTHRATISGGSTNRAEFLITDSSNVELSGTQNNIVGVDISSTPRFYNTLIAYDSPATTSATTYKGRFNRSTAGSLTLQNSTTTGQMIALEISA